MQDKLIEVSECKLTDKVQYRVKGADGWTLVTNDKKIAEEAASGNREFGSNRVSRGIV